jgi:hypothetical protein
MLAKKAEAAAQYKPRFQTAAHGAKPCRIDAYSKLDKENAY